MSAMNEKMDEWKGYDFSNPVNKWEFIKFKIR
jgi:hypothetical protein